MPENASATTPQKPLRVLHVASGIDERAGGVTTAIIAMAQAQHDAGMEVSVVSVFGAHHSPSGAEKLRAGGVNVTLIGPHGRLLAHHRDIARRLPSLIASADIVHIHALWESIQHQAAVISRRLNKPHLFTAHGMLDPWSLGQRRFRKSLYMKLLLRRDLEHAAAIHFTNAIERDRARELNLRTPTLVEKYIIDCREFEHPPPAGSFRAEFPQLRDHRVSLFLGRLHPKKGLDLLLPAFAAAGLADAMLVLAGPVDDDYRIELQQRADQLGIAPRVLFTGMLAGESRLAAFADAEVFVLPSYQENVGIAVIESLAAGTPVIISDQVNIHPEIAAAGVGTVVPTQIEPLTRAITTCLTDEKPRAIIAAECRAFVREQYDRLALAARWRGHYAGLIASNCSASCVTNPHRNLS